MGVWALLSEGPSCGVVRGHLGPCLLHAPIFLSGHRLTLLSQSLQFFSGRAESLPVTTLLKIIKSGESVTIAGVPLPCHLTSITASDPHSYPECQTGLFALLLFLIAWRV